MTTSSHSIVVARSLNRLMVVEDIRLYGEHWSSNARTRIDAPFSLISTTAIGNTEMVRVLTNASAVGRDSPGSSTFFDPRENELLYRATALENELSFSGISLLKECKREWWLFWQKRHLSSLMQVFCECWCAKQFLQ